jgi:glucose-1-phosphate adenylyltransferase
MRHDTSLALQQVEDLVGLFQFITLIEGAIIDKNARIGDGVVITPNGKPANVDGDNYYIRDGVVVVPKNAVIPAGTRI